MVLREVATSVTYARWRWLAAAAWGQAWAAACTSTCERNGPTHDSGMDANEG